MLLTVGGVEFCNEVAVGGSGGGEFVVAVLKFLAEVEDLLLELTELGSKLFGFVAAPDAAVSEDFVAEGFGEPAVEFGVLASEAFVLVAEVGEVGVQRSLADRRGGRAGVGCFRAGDDPGAQVMVAVEEGPVDACCAGDGGDGELFSGSGEFVERGEDSLAAVGAVSSAGSDQRVG